MGQTLIESHRFWNLVDFFCEQNRAISFNEIKDIFDLPADVLMSVVNVLKRAGFDFELTQRQGDIEIQCRKIPHIESQINVLDLVKLVGLKQKIDMGNETYKAFSILEKMGRDNSEDLIRGFAEIEQRYGQYFDESNIVQLNKQNRKHIESLEKALLTHHVLQIMLKNLDDFTIYPHRIVHIEGELCLIGEDLEEGECIHWLVKDIVAVKELELNYKPLYSKIEVNDYLSSLRNISENEVRLILKVSGDVDLQEPQHHYFGNPVKVKKSGDSIIWAASVEPNEEIFEWLCTLGSSVEIIDPSAFKRLFLRYCENKLVRMAR